MNEFVDTNLANGFIVPLKSPMASPFFFVGKKKGWGAKTDSRLPIPK